MPTPSAKVISALEKQADHEFLASQNYLAMSYWCEVQQHSGFAAFFKKQSGEELAHANKILKHLADRDVLPQIGAVPAPVLKFKSLLEVAQAAYDFERANTSGIHAAYEAALAEKDYPAQVMLHWFINEQVEEEAWSDKLLVKTREAGCAGALLNLDRHLEKILAGDSE
jgi:ferritin